MVVAPPSISLAPVEPPAASPVIKQFTEPPAQLPSCSGVPPLLVGSGSPRSQRPVTAKLAPGVNVQPRAASKSSLYTTCVAVGCNSAVNVVSFTGVVISCVAAPPSDHDTNS